MSDTGRGRGALTRAGLEMVIIILGVVVGLAVDRWVAGIDDRAQADAWAIQLADDIERDSVVIATLLRDFERMSDFGIAALHMMDGTGQEFEDPAAFVANLESAGWWISFDPQRETWDEIVASGMLGVFNKAEVRKALTEYYGRLEFLAVIESRWAPVFDRYWAHEQTVIPPLTRIAAIDGRFGATPDRPITEADAIKALEAFRRDPAVQGAFGTVVQTYRYGQPVLRGMFRYMTAARTALLER